MFHFEIQHPSHSPNSTNKGQKNRITRKVSELATKERLYRQGYGICISNVRHYFTCLGWGRRGFLASNATYRVKRFSCYFSQESGQYGSRGGGRPGVRVEKVHNMLF